ncbi:hypothetical protein ABPG74_001885 [Tetrahymena malaccensis]
MAQKQDYSKQQSIIDKLNFSYQPLQLFGSLRQYADQNIKSEQLKQAYYDAFNKFPQQILIRGDGNCFYRSFMLCYLFTIFIQKNSTDLLKLFHKVLNLSTLIYIIENITQDQINLTEEFKYSFLNFWIRVFIKYQTLLKQNQKFELMELFTEYNCEPFVDAATIIICRNIILDKFLYLLTDPNYCFFITDESRDSSPKNLKLYGQEAEDVIIPIAAKAFEIDLIVKNIYRINQEIFQDEYEYKFEDSIKSNIVSVLFTKGHYNSLFTNEICSINSQAILWPQEDKQETIQMQQECRFNDYQQQQQIEIQQKKDFQSNQENKLVVNNLSQKIIEKVCYSLEQQEELLEYFACKTCNRIIDGYIILTQNKAQKIQQCLKCMSIYLKQMEEQTKKTYKRVDKNMKKIIKCKNCETGLNYFKRFKIKSYILLRDHYCINCLDQKYQEKEIYKPIEYQVYQFRDESFSQNYICFECKKNMSKLNFVIRYRNHADFSFYFITCNQCFIQKYYLFFNKLNQVQKQYGPINNFFDKCKQCQQINQVFKLQDGQELCLSCIKTKLERKGELDLNQLLVYIYQTIYQKHLCINCLSYKTEDDSNFEVLTPKQNQNTYKCILCQRCILRIFKFKNVNVEKKFKIFPFYFQREIELQFLFSISQVKEMVLTKDKIKN